MAQQETVSKRKEVASSKQQPSSMRFETCLSQPAPINQHEFKSRRHLTLPIPLNNNYPQSTAERYILFRSQMLVQPNEQQDISPETPSSIAGASFSALQSPMSHEERMRKWHQQQMNDVKKKQKHRYVYGPPAPSSSKTFSSPLYSNRSIQSNISLSSPKNATGPSPSVKNDNSREEPKKIESRHKFTAV